MKNLALLSILLLLAACASTQPDIEMRPQGSSGEFVITCPMNSRAADDPIVKPGQAGASHSHDFFGARKIDANSTPESIKASGTSCDKTPGDTAGYWTPTVYKADGTPLQMERARLYYRTGGIRKDYIKPFPQGLKIVAGDAMAMEPQDFDVVSWACTIAGGGDAGNEREVEHLPVCPSDSPSVRLKIIFPNCWNGRDLDSADHKSHMAYSSRDYGTANRCPVGWTAVPRLVIGVRYPFRSSPTSRNATFLRTDAPHLVLNMGHYSGHADFWNTWDQHALKQLVSYCLNGGRLCGASGGPR